MTSWAQWIHGVAFLSAASPRRPLALGLVAGLWARAQGLPINAALGAHNAVEIPVDPGVIQAARTLYREHIGPRLIGQRGSFQSGDLAWYVSRPPGWESDLSWWSADDGPTYRHLEAELFQRINLNALRGRIDLEHAIRLYCPFFVVRSQCLRTRLHKDYVWACGTNSYTLMTPLQDASDEAGHLVYLDMWGRPCFYCYILGWVIVFGTGFLHGT